MACTELSSRRFKFSSVADLMFDYSYSMADLVARFGGSGAQERAALMCEANTARDSFTSSFLAENCLLHQKSIFEQEDFVSGSSLVYILIGRQRASGDAFLTSKTPRREQ